jgi:hypothetical protein
MIRPLQITSRDLVPMTADYSAADQHRTRRYSVLVNEPFGDAGKSG